MDKRCGDGACCFVVHGVADTMKVTYVIVSGAREHGDLLVERERERSQRQSLDCVHMNKEELTDQAKGKFRKVNFA